MLPTIDKKLEHVKFKWKFIPIFSPILGHMIWNLKFLLRNISKFFKFGKSMANIPKKCHTCKCLLLKQNSFSRIVILAMKMNGEKGTMG